MIHNKHRYYMSVAGVNLTIETDEQLVITERYIPFFRETKEGHAKFKAYFSRVDRLPRIKGKLLHEESCYHVYSDEEKNFIKVFFEDGMFPRMYAMAEYEENGKALYVRYLESGIQCVSSMHKVFFHMGLEKILIQERRVFVHASCVESSVGGILFSGPSGIGKSTQAELWCRFRNARQINGDRPILSNSENGWRAWGSPYAGSSKCYVNDSCCVNVIVMLQQSKECNLKRLEPLEAFKMVWEGMIVHSWDKMFVETASAIVLELVKHIPIYRFACTADEQAVLYLEKELRKDCANEE